MLCQTCQDITFQPLEVWRQNLGPAIVAYPTPRTVFDWDIGLYGVNIQGKKLLYYPHKSSLKDLQASAHMSCSFCSIILDGFLQDRIHGLSIESSQSNIMLRVKVKPAPGMVNEWTMENDFFALCRGALVMLRWQYLDCKLSRMGLFYPDDALLVAYVSLDEVGQLNSSLSIDREGSTNYFSTGSASNLKLAAYWVKDCLNNHLECTKASPTLPPLPKRVLDVGPQDGSKVPLLHAKPGNAPYAVLSHCWGNAPIRRTLLSNIADHKRGIELHSLSQTFQDAIFVTRSLDIRYLWIDSLCIIQDSLSDWDEQSAQMAEIYHQAQVMIAANKGYNSAAGCFAMRNPLAIKPCPMELGFGSCADLQEKVFVYQALSFSYESGPLKTRAWCFQEELLSVRSIAFGSNQIAWKCRTAMASESCPAYSGNSGETTQVASYDVSSAETSETRSIHEAYYKWYSIATAFSKRNITRDSDRLPALIGIAKTYKPLVRDSYIAGLWKKDLIYGLLWQRPNYKPIPNGAPGPRRHTTAEQYLAPSWSWVSLLDTEILFQPMPPGRNPPRPGLSSVVESQHCDDSDDSETDESEVQPEGYELPLLRILQAETTLTGTSTYGQVSDGVLKVHGLVRQHSYQAEMASERGPRPESEGVRDLGRIDWDLAAPPDDTVWCLLVLQRFGGVLDNTELFFLVLERTGIREEEYRRCGMGRVLEKDWFKKGDWKFLTIV
jgi:hypothetical protein